MDARTAVAAQQKEAGLTGPAASKVPMLMQDRFGTAEHKQNSWIVDAEATVTLAHVQDPSFWAHVARDMTPFDHVTVRWDDGSKLAYLIVVMCEKNYAIVQLDRVIEIRANASTPASSIKHRVEYKGGHVKFCVIRNSDDKVLHESCKTREEADAWLRSYEKAQ